MHPDAELGLDERHEPACSDPPVPGSADPYELEDLRGDLVRPAGSAPRRDQPRQPAPAERLDHPEAGRPRHPEPLGRLCQGGFPAPDQPDHLVADLQQVLGIEEVAGGEHRIPDLVRRPVEGACLLEASPLLVLISVGAHGRIRGGRSDHIIVRYYLAHVERSPRAVSSMYRITQGHMPRRGSALDPVSA